MRDSERLGENDDSAAHVESADSAEEPTRDEERGEASEPDAPVGGAENEGMSTILDGSAGTGVQDDIDDE